VCARTFLDPAYTPKAIAAPFASCVNADSTMRTILFWHAAGQVTLIASLLMNRSREVVPGCSFLLTRWRRKQEEPARKAEFSAVCVAVRRRRRGTPLALAPDSGLPHQRRSPSQPR
jgi:hypothetical protein